MTDPCEGFLARFLQARESTSRRRSIARIAMGGLFVGAGISHLTFAREEFAALVPAFVPFESDAVVVASGVVEISLGAALMLLAKRRVPLGWAAALFLVAVFPGNISQWVHAREEFGMDTDSKRFVRLLFQPVLVAAALWSTAAWRDRPRGGPGLGEGRIGAGTAKGCPARGPHQSTEAGAATSVCRRGTLPPLDVVVRPWRQTCRPCGSGLPA